MKYALNAFLAFSLVALTGCGTTAIEVSKSNYEAATQRVAQERAKHETVRREAIVQEKDGVSIVGRPFALDTRRVLPPILEKPFVFAHTEPTPAVELMRRLSAISGVAISFRQDALDALRDQQDGQQKQTQAQAGGDSATPLDRVVQQMALGPDLVVPPYQGTLAELLDRLVAQIGLSWEWRNAQVEIFRNVRKTFVVDVSNQAVVTSATISTDASSSSSDGQGASTSSASSQSFSAKTAAQPWQELIAQIKSLLTPKGQVLGNQGLGTITVIDTPAAVARVTPVIEQHNRMASKRIMVTVDVYEVSSDVSSEFGIDWDGIIQSGNLSGVLNTNNAFTSGDGFLTATLNDVDEKLNGTTWLLKALAKEGRVSRVNHFVANVQNGLVQPFQDVVERRFIESATTNVSTTTATTDLKTGVVTSGITMQLRPRVLSDGSILLTSTFTFSALLGIETVNANNTLVSLPTRRMQTLTAEAKTRPGQAVMVAGFRSSRTNTDKSGTGHQDAWLLGGSRKDESGTGELIIIIKPIIAS